MHLTACAQRKSAAAETMISGAEGPRAVHGGMGTGVQTTKTQKQGTELKALCKRTRMCKFNLVGSCTRGSACSFSHKKVDLRKEPDLWKTKLCSSFSLSGGCKQGNTCKFAHGLRELRELVCETDPEPPDGQSTSSRLLQDPHDRLLVAKLFQETLLSMHLRMEQQAMEDLPNLSHFPCSAPKRPPAPITRQPMMLPLVPDASHQLGCKGPSTQSEQRPPPSFSRQSTVQPPSTDALPELGYKAFSRQTTMQSPSTDALPELSHKAVLLLGTMSSPKDEDNGCDNEGERSLANEEQVIITVKNTFIHAVVNSPSPRRSKSQPACFGRL
eukprot:TRINITY_DN8398_c0_g1_i1.p1 TRINITY_DN8398_c0_g1~~TRINITY_DN8398_c0_g1_i1.p1  ORF type:complete len:328 (-),score=61.88 TRINITY_DN8398_c0_g1_i1:137-1120(-)